MNAEVRDKLKEAREWGTFVLSFLTIIAIPFGLSVLHNQRLEIERDIANSYVHNDVYREDRSRIETVVGQIQGKLDSVLLEQVHVNDNMAVLKERFK